MECYIYLQHVIGRLAERMMDVESSAESEFWQQKPFGYDPEWK